MIELLQGRSRAIWRGIMFRSRPSWALDLSMAPNQNTEHDYVDNMPGIERVHDLAVSTEQ